MPKKILMCPPDHYDIEYEINPWMDIKNKVDRALVQRQYLQLKQLYQKLGAEIWELNAAAGLPDMVYSANHGYAQDRNFIKANFRYEQRRNEADLAAKFMSDKGYTVHSLPEDIFFEGEGDLIRTKNKFFLGYGKRSMPGAAKYIAQIIEQELIPLEVINPFFYHLDMCFGPLDDDTVIINDQAFMESDLAKIKANFSNVIIASREDNQAMVCNLVVVDKHVVMGAGISNSLRKQIKELGYEVHQVPMSEYIKGGGSVKCLSLELF